MYFLPAYTIHDETFPANLCPWVASSCVPLCLYVHRTLCWWSDQDTCPTLTLLSSGIWTALVEEVMLAQSMLVVVQYVVAVSWHNHCPETAGRQNKSCIAIYNYSKYLGKIT